MMDNFSNENALIELAKSGDRRAFLDLLGNRYDWIYQACFRRCRQADAAGDICQEVCLKIARSIGFFSGQSSFSTWIYRIIINTTTDWHRKHKDMLNIDDMEIPSDHPADHPQSTELAKDIQYYLHQLPTRQREAVILVCVEEKSHRQAAELLGCAEGTISWHISQARKHIIAMMKHE